MRLKESAQTLEVLRSTGESPKQKLFDLAGNKTKNIEFLVFLVLLPESTAYKILLKFLIIKLRFEN